MSLNRITEGPSPRIVVTLGLPERAPDPDRVRRGNERYLDQLRAAGAEVVPLDESSDELARRDAFETMDGLLLSGGADVDPSLYGQRPDGTRRVEPERDALELAAWRSARARRVPVLGICRGFQAVNVFSGGTLVQHLDGHESAPGTDVPLRTHPLRLRAGSRLARLLRPGGVSAPVVTVNTSHHQGVRAENLAPGLIVSGTSPHPDGELVEAFESADPREFVIGVQSHPERTESTAPEFSRLWTVFVDAARGGARGGRVG